MSPTASPTDPTLAAAREAFSAAYVEAVVLEDDRAAAEELAREAAPTLEALRRWGQMDASEPDALRRSEALAMVSLLGRRAARLDISPSAVLALVEGLIASLRQSSRPLEGVARALRAICIEGYVAAGAERVEERRAALWAEQQAILEFVSHGLLVVPSGCVEPAQVTELGERFVRALFRKEARVGWVDLSALGDASIQHASALLGVNEGAAMLGCACVFSGVDPGWREAFSEACDDPSVLTLEPSFDAGMGTALDVLEHEVRPRGPLAAALRRLRRR